MLALTFLATALLAVGAAASLYQKSSDNPTAVIDNGAVVGTKTSLPDSKTPINKFLGIPFGAPPIRFSPPKPAESWSTPYDATEFKPSCIQKFNCPEASLIRTIKNFNTPPPPAGEDEDCLNLDIWAPTDAAPGSKPVLFWIHGGRFSHGSGSLPMNEGSKFAAFEDLVVVTINYRTNIFGFPESLDLPKGEQNLGFLYQRLALDWIQRNIGAFGGDSRQVTIMGDSSGAGSVGALLTSPPDPVPFRAAILQSGDATATLKPSGSWANVTKITGCDKDNFADVLECLRDIPATKLKEHVEKAMLDFKPLSDDGITLSNHPRANRLGSEDDPSLMARVPILAGTTADEGRLPDLKGVDLEAALRFFIPDVTRKQIELFKNLYPLGSTGINNDYDQVATILTEAEAQCPARFTTDEYASVDVKTWRYIYNASFANAEVFKGSGAFHGSEIATLFGTYPEKGATEFQDELSREMQGAWASFIRDPGAGPGWESVPKIGVFGDGVRPDTAQGGEEPLRVVDPDVVDRRCKYFKKMWEDSNP
ncbi:hypothetical protein FZEAL_6153 [Fusarium zealandicum]|uniref:Carboxylic ester hydrolase n=1 Tax=Fusarium zealandicum TaxID=1053134 RepID=A0A8H4XJ45_9HYPO|nr:hypothetical protein FZEAL_6153 [Fusarium zealandicum]